MTEKNISTDIIGLTTQAFGSLNLLWCVSAVHSGQLIESFIGEHFKP